MTVALMSRAGCVLAVVSSSAAPLSTDCAFGSSPANTRAIAENEAWGEVGGLIETADIETTLTRAHHSDKQFGRGRAHGATRPAMTISGHVIRFGSVRSPQISPNSRSTAVIGSSPLAARYCVVADHVRM